MKRRDHSLYLAAIFASVLVLVAGGCKRQDLSKAPQNPPTAWPVAAVFEWSMGLPSDTPAFVLYSDGRIIVRRTRLMGEPRSEPVYWTRMLSADEFSEIDRAVAAAMCTPDLQDEYEMKHPPASDEFLEASTGLYFGVSGEGMMISVGEFQFSHVRSISAVDADHYWRQLPDSIADYGRHLLALTAGDGEQWLPSEYTVTLTSVARVEATALRWPDGWSKPQMSAKRREGDERAYTKITASDLAQLRSRFGEKYSDHYFYIEAAGKTYVGDCRPYFPGEESWRDATPFIVSVPTNFLLEPMMISPEPPRPMVDKPAPAKITLP